MQRATGSIESKSFGFQPVEELEGGGKLVRMSAVDLFHGDIEGQATAEFVAMLAQDNSSRFAGMYKLSGALQGRRGSFLLEVSGSSDARGLSRGTWKVVPNSGTAGLAGLRGTGEFSHQSKGPSSLHLDYELEV